MADLRASYRGETSTGDTGTITHVQQEQTSAAIREKSAYARWCEREEARLRSVQHVDDFDRAFDNFEAERDARREKLREMDNLARKERLERPSPPVVLPQSPDPQDNPPSGSFKKIGLPWEFSQPTIYSEIQVAPTKTFIYSGGPAVSSDLIWCCPDLMRWSSWFNDDEVTLDQGYRYWFPSARKHPMVGPFEFTGKFVVSTHFKLSGLVDIGKYGSVTVDIATYLTVVECTASDRDHDYGWHYDPAFDQVVSSWRSYCDGNQQRIFFDNLPGLHDFLHYIDLPVQVACDCGAPNRFIETTHILTIRCINAWCCFGPNRADCEAGTHCGWVTTYWPRICLEYAGPIPWQMAFPAL
jgi:hypothetical protein